MWDTGRRTAFDTEELQKGLLEIHPKGGESSQITEPCCGREILLNKNQTRAQRHNLTITLALLLFYFFIFLREKQTLARCQSTE